jgi:Asp-tRNA(Asn)/Glu-tRNA(Gln) amidotransferase C subunit
MIEKFTTQIKDILEYANKMYIESTGGSKYKILFK